MLEYRQHFGGPPMVAFEVKVKYITDDTTEDPNDLILESIIIPPESESDFILYYALKHYFENGGGPCYVVSVGTYKTDGGPVAKELKGEDGNRQGLRAVEQLDEPTLLVFPDATKLNSDNYGDVCSSALMQCKELGDRFTIMDMDYQGIIELGTFRGALPSGTDL